MRLIKFSSVFALFISICTVSEGIAQKIVQRSLRWEQSEITNTDEKTFRTVESFPGAIFVIARKICPFIRRNLMVVIAM